jgi:hypothetical protein
MSHPFEGQGGGLFQSVSGFWMEADKESVRWQFFALFRRPATAFRYFGSRRHELGIWSRGHFRFALFEASAMSAILLVWYLFPEFKLTLKSLLFTLFVCFIRHFLTLGVTVSLVVSALLNKFGLAVRSYRESHQDVDWRFCFDAFCNGTVAFIFDFLIGYLIVHIGEICWPQNWFFAFFLPNSLFLAASLHFIYLFVGTLNVLPFIKRLKTVHFAIAPICGYVLSLICRWRVPMKCLSLNFLSR